MQLKTFQLDDIARLSLLDGAILSWGTGLGKSMAMFAWAFLKCGWSGRLKVKAPVLIVSPEDLHQQTIGEGVKWFNILTEPLKDVDLSQPIPPGFYIASYAMLRTLDIKPDAFTCVMLDEGDKSKKSGSDAGRYVRRLTPKYRLIATATPMADRLPDLFWLCSWVCANDPPGAKRWPYAPTQGEYGAFAGRFQVDGESMTRRRSSGAFAKERSAEISQLMLLWRWLGAIVLRRRIEDCGEDVIQVEHQIVPCPLGWQQKREYEQALFNPGLEIAERLGALRRIAGGAGWPNPKLAKALELIANVMGRRQQVIVASDFRGPNDSLCERLTDAGIPHVLMDGRTDPEARGELAEQFKQGSVPVALIGLKSGAEGQSYPKCNNLIILNYSWEYKKLPQVIGRARRINSERDLNVWSLVADGTIENRMAQLIVDEKAVAADLVLDGIWPGKESNLDPAGWLDVATKEFKPNAKTIDENELAAQWPGLKDRLRRVRAWSTNSCLRA
jgi:hypothetical protein